MSAPLLLALFAALSGAAPAEPTIAVVVVRRAALPRAPATDVANQVAMALQSSGMAVGLPPDVVEQKLRKLGVEAESCEGVKECVVAVGTKLGAQIIVAVELGALGKSVAIHLDAITIPEGKRLAQHDLIAQQDGLRKLTGLSEFGARLHAALPGPAAADKPKVEPPPPPPVVTVRDTKAHPDLAPSVPPQAIARPAEPPQKSHALGYVFTGSAIGAAVASGVLLTVAMLGKNAIGNDTQSCPSGVSGTCYKQSWDIEHARAQKANNEFAASLGCLGGAVLLGVGAAIAW
jgi:hypothetical protein